MIRKGRLYSIIIIACFAGYIWIYFGLSNSSISKNQVCLIKKITDIPCPSCGTTRSIISILKGNYADSIINPLGYIVFMIMLLAPVLIIYDILFKKQSLFNYYNRIEVIFKNPKYSAVFIFLMILNWIWNITKGN